MLSPFANDHQIKLTDSEYFCEVVIYVIENSSTNLELEVGSLELINADSELTEETAETGQVL